MFDKETLIVLQQAASINMAHLSIKQADETHDTAALPSDYVLHDLEGKNPNRRRARGIMATAALASFVGYTREHAELGTSVFVDADTMRATAILNLGTPFEPGHADNKAIYAPEKTADYRALLRMADGSAHKQAPVAEFLEDWPELIKCFNADGEIAPPKAIAAIRKMSLDAIRKAESSVQALSESRSAFESVSATSSDPLPTHIYFTCQPYANLAERLFVLRLNVATGGDKPMIGLRIVKAEQHQEEMATELVELISQQFAMQPLIIGTHESGNQAEAVLMEHLNIPVLQGTYSKAN